MFVSSCLYPSIEGQKAQSVKQKARSALCFMLSAFSLTTKLTSVDIEYERIRYFFISLRLLTFSMRLYLLIFLFILGNAVKAQNLDSVNSRLNRLDSVSTVVQDTVSLIQQDSLANAQDTLS